MAEWKRRRDVSPDKFDAKGSSILWFELCMLVMVDPPWLERNLSFNQIPFVYRERLDKLVFDRGDELVKYPH